VLVVLLLLVDCSGSKSDRAVRIGGNEQYQKVGNGDV
jgi:hypothetical protein